VGFQAHHTDEDRQHDQGLQPAEGDQRHHHGDRAGDECPKEGDESAHEGQRRDRQPEVRAENQRAHARSQAIGGRDRHGRPDVIDQGPPAVVQPGAKSRARIGWDEPLEAAPDALAVLEEKERCENGHKHASHEAANAGAELGQIPGDRRLA